jgi:hypothetical protein
MISLQNCKFFSKLAVLQFNGNGNKSENSSLYVFNSVGTIDNITHPDAYRTS